MRTTGRRLALIGVAVLALAGLMAVCGDDNSSDTASNGSTTSTTSGSSSTSETTTTTAPAADLTVTVKDDAKNGTILADPQGMTLYTLTDASGAAVDCTGPCLAAWPPLALASGAMEPTAPEGVTLTLVDGPDGSKLVAADDLPLYTFAGDGSAADAKGEGLASFGGTWHVVKTDAAVTTPTSSGGGGGGTDDTTTTTSTY